jgi:hypothetical protein
MATAQQKELRKWGMDVYGKNPKAPMTPKVQEFLAKVLAKEPKSEFELWAKSGEVAREYRFVLSEEESGMFCDALDAIGERLESRTH